MDAVKLIGKIEPFNIKGRGLILCVNHNDYAERFKVGSQVIWNDDVYSITGVEMSGIGNWINPLIGLVVRKVQ